MRSICKPVVNKTQVEVLMLKDVNMFVNNNLQRAIECVYISISCKFLSVHKLEH